MIRGVTEVGVAVRDLDQATQLLVARLGAIPGPLQRFEPYGMAFRMCRVGNLDFELMAPLTEDGVIGRFLERFGEGLHHIGFEVDDVAATRAELSSRGLGFVDDAPRRARILVADARGKLFDDECQFTFSRPGTLLGMLLEFIQYPPGFSLASVGAPPPPVD